MYRVIKPENLKDDGVYFYNSDGNYDWVETHRFLHGTRAQCIHSNNILEKDEILFCEDLRCEKRYKIGDGESCISELPFVLLRDCKKFVLRTTSGAKFCYCLKEKD